MNNAQFIQVIEQIITKYEIVIGSGSNNELQKYRYEESNKNLSRIIAQALGLNSTLPQKKLLRVLSKYTGWTVRETGIRLYREVDSYAHKGGVYNLDLLKNMEVYINKAALPKLRAFWKVLDRLSLFEWNALKTESNKTPELLLNRYEDFKFIVENTATNPHILAFYYNAIDSMALYTPNYSNINNLGMLLFTAELEILLLRQHKPSMDSILLALAQVELDMSQER